MILTDFISQALSECSKAIGENKIASLDIVERLFDKEEQLRMAPKSNQDKIDDEIKLPDLSTKDDDKYIGMLDDPEQLLRELKKENH